MHRSHAPSPALAPRATRPRAPTARRLTTALVAGLIAAAPGAALAEGDCPIPGFSAIGPMMVSDWGAVARTTLTPQDTQRVIATASPVPGERRPVLRFSAEPPGSTRITVCAARHAAGEPFPSSVPSHAQLIGQWRPGDLDETSPGVASGMLPLDVSGVDFTDHLVFVKMRFTPGTVGEFGIPTLISMGDRDMAIGFTLADQADPGAPSPEAPPPAGAALGELLAGQTIPEGLIDHALGEGPAGLGLAAGLADADAPEPEPVTEAPTEEPEITLGDLNLDPDMADLPQMAPYSDTTVPAGATGAVQTDPTGRISAPTTAAVSAVVTVELHDAEPNDYLLRVNADAPDDTMTGRFHRGDNRVGNNTQLGRRMGDFPGTQQLRLMRGDAVLARLDVELFDVEFDLQTPTTVVAGEHYHAYLNPVSRGHLYHAQPDSPDDPPGRHTIMRHIIYDADGPQMIRRRAPAEPGTYELRYHFNPGRPSEVTARTGRLMARAPLRVVAADDPDAPAPEAAEAIEQQLSELEAQIAALSEDVDAVTLSQTQETRDTIAAIGLPALALLVELMSRDAVAPQVAQALTAPVPPAQWPGVAPAPVQPASAVAPAQPTAPAAPAPAQPATPAATPDTAASYQVTGVAGGDVLNVRSAPGTENTIVGMLPPSAGGITLTGQSARAADGGTWWEIADPTLPGGTGWVNARFLMAEAAPASAPAAPAPIAETVQTVQTVQTWRVTNVAPNEVLYLRAAPSAEAQITGILPPDATGIIATGARQMTDGFEWMEIEHAEAPPDGRAWVDTADLMPEARRPNVLDVAQAFTDQPGATAIDPDELWQRTEAILHYARQDSALAPGAELSALTRAIVAVQATDGRLPHARYHLTLGQAEIGTRPDGSAMWLDVIELRRFNLGPARHAATVAAHGAENTAELSAFGEGPDVHWRFAMRPVMGTDADVLSASRAEIDAPERDCMGFHCLIGQAIIPHLADWDEMQPAPVPAFRPSYDALWRGAPSAPAVLDMLALGTHRADTGGHDARWSRFEPRYGHGPDEPFVEVILEVGMGQDAGAEVMLFETSLKDDELRSVWHRLAAFGGPDAPRVFTARAAERWPDRQ